jgi:hypothetical protein
MGPSDLRRWSAAVGALALSAFGCGGGSSKPPCAPDLTVNWAIVDSTTNVAMTCSQVGATTIRVTIDGQSTDSICPSGQSAGSIAFALDFSGPHTVTVGLLDGTTVLAQFGANTIDVDCSGTTQTPVVTLAVGNSCFPDLYVNWRIVESGTGTILTCDTVPATTVRVNISGVVTDFPCPVGVSQEQIPFYLDVTGTYTVMVSLLDGATVLSQTGTNSINVDCSGQTQTPLIDLVVN